MVLTWILYGVILLLVATQGAFTLAQLDIPKADKCIALVIMIIFAPIICAYNAVEGLLDLFLPPGWDSGDDNDERKM